jgi:SAM-dependent methyltransferase
MWEHHAARWKIRRNDDWRRCVTDPSVGLERNTLELIDRFVGALAGKRVCVLGSGDNYAVFVLAGMGAQVTSVDFSEHQLQIAAERADELGLDIEFQQADITELDAIEANTYDFVLSTNGVMVWIATPEQYYAQVQRILKPGGVFLSYDIHPFQRPWSNHPEPFQMVKPYTHTGPIERYYHPESGETYSQPSEIPSGQREAVWSVYNFHWTLSQLLNALKRSGLHLLYLQEDTEVDAAFWQIRKGPNIGTVNAENATNWQENPRAGLPMWLTLVAQK